MAKILSKKQIRFLKLLSSNKTITDKFYLTGGTALCEHYIPYRYSEDLDFFSEQEFCIQDIITILKSMKKDLKYLKLDINTSFNRNIFFLKFKKEFLKVEFTYFPFPQIEIPKRKNNIKIDSLLDIAVNKLFTIYQKPRSRDFIDLFMINTCLKIKIAKLIKYAKIKFDWHIDPITLGTQFKQVNKLKDYPNLRKPIHHKKWKDYFLKEANKLKKNIFKNAS